LEKATWGLAGTFIFLCILTPRFISRQTTDIRQQSEMQQQINDVVMIDPNLIAPDFGTALPIEE
jgi:preprotein translocase subunit SecG